LFIIIERINLYNLGIFLFQGDGGAGMLTSLLPFVLIIFVFYFLILRPQQKRQKEKQKLLDSIKKGDKVITSAGIYGTIEGIEDKTVLVKISDTSKVKMERASIVTIIGANDDQKQINTGKEQK
jgi:preprotein translocase subunit YajC